MPTLLAGYHGRLIWVGRLRHLDLLCSPRSRKIHWLMGTRSFELGDSRYRIQSRHSSLLRDIDDCRSSVSRYSSSAVLGSFHVGALSHTQLQRHQLLSQAGTWRSCRSDFVFHLRVRPSLGPLAMGAASDHFGDPKYGFMLATVFASLLFVALLLNQIFNPTRNRLQQSRS